MRYTIAAESGLVIGPSYRTERRALREAVGIAASWAEPLKIHAFPDGPNYAGYPVLRVWKQGPNVVYERIAGVNNP
jgi:hypothetical protein